MYSAEILQYRGDKNIVTHVAQVHTVFRKSAFQQTEDLKPPVLSLVLI